MQTLNVPENELRLIIREEIAEVIKEEFYKLKAMMIPGIPLQTPKGKKKSRIDRPNWEDLYGIGKGIWKADAQDYVDTLREERF